MTFFHTDQKIMLTVDTVVFSVIKGELSILLIKRKYDPFKGKYALPGGFVKNDEDLDTAARRELQEETGVSDIFLKKITAYGTPGRDPRGRVVTIVYLALIDADRFRLNARTDAVSAEWKTIHDIPPLAFDHKKILDEALHELRYDVQTTNIASQLLPDKFTLTELQNLYEHVLGMPLDKRNFRKRISSLDILKETNETRMDGAHRPALLYKFKTKTYQQLREKIHVFV